MTAQRKYPEELRERAVKMVLEVRERDGKGHGEIARVGRRSYSASVSVLLLVTW
jgi:transposase